MVIVTVAYRQYVGKQQLCAAATDDIMAVDDWNVYTNVNSNETLSGAGSL